MKFKKEELLNVLGIMKPALAKREMTEQATHFGFSGQDIVAFNDSVCIVHPLEADFKCSVPADQFYKIIDKMPGEEVEIAMVDDKLEISSGRTRSGILVQDGKALLGRVNAIGIDKIDKFRKMPSEFLTAITLCAFSASTDAANANITGVLVRSNSALSTDTLRISEYLMDGEFNKSFNIPASSVRELIKFPVTHYHISDNWAYFATKDDVVFCAKLLEADKYPANITRFFNLEGIEFELPDMFRQSVETAMIMVEAATEEEKLIEVEIDKDHIRCRGSNDIAWIENEVEGKVDIAKRIRFNINPGHLLKIMEQTRKLVYGEERALFRSNNFQHLICLIPADDAPAQAATKKKAGGKKKKEKEE